MAKKIFWESYTVERTSDEWQEVIHRHDYYYETQSKEIILEISETLENTRTNTSHLQTSKKSKILRSKLPIEAEARLALLLKQNVI